MSHRRSKLEVDIESAKDPNTIINEIKTAEIYKPSINYRQYNYDTNSDNSLDLDINMDEYLPGKSVDEPNIGEQQQRSASFSEHYEELVDDVLDLNIDSSNDLVFDYATEAKFYSDCAQTNVGNVFPETQTSVSNYSANMSQQIHQFQNTHQLIPMQIPITAQPYNNSSSDFINPESRHPIASTISSSGVLFTNQNPTQVGLNCELNDCYFPFVPYSQPNPVQEMEINDTQLSSDKSTSIASTPIKSSMHARPPMLAMPSMPTIYSIPSTPSIPNILNMPSMTTMNTMPSVSTLQYDYQLINNLNDPPNHITIKTERKSRQSMSSIDIPTKQLPHISKRVVQSISLPNMTISSSTIKRAISTSRNTQPRKKSVTEREKREMWAQKERFLDGENQLLKSRVFVLENEIIKHRELLKNIDGTVPDTSQHESN